MANSYVEYTSVAGGTTNLNVPFSYLDPAQVELYIDNVLQTVVTHYNFTSPTNIALVTPTSGGEDILIQRRTEIDSAAVTFSNAMLVDTDLNTSHLQNFYLHQEVVDGLAIGTYPILGTAITSGAATDGQVLTADGAGGVAWEDLITILQGIENPWTADVDAGGYKLTGLGTVGTDTAVAPALTFGDGDTGLYESSDDVLTMSVSGADKWTFATSYFGNTNNTRSAFLAEGATATNPNIVARRVDVDTGIGSNGDDSVSLIAGGVEAIRVTESVGTITVAITDSMTFGDSDYISFGDGGDALVSYENAGNRLLFDLTPLTSSAVFDLDALSNFEIREDGNERITIDIFQGLFEIHDGFEMRFIEQSGTDYGSIQNDGVGMVFDHNTGGSYFFDGGGNLLLREGGSLAVYDASNSDYALFVHDGTDLNMNFLGTSAWNINLNTSAEVVIDNGATVFSEPALTMQGDAPTIQFYDDGAATDNKRWMIGQASETFRIRCFNDARSTNGDAVAIARTGNSIDYVRLFGGTDDVLQTQAPTTAGNTSGVQVVDHGNTYRDVGFNDLAEEGWGASDTLQELHAGGSWGKANTVARTLTLLPTTNTNFPVGATCEIYNFGTSGNLTVSEGASGTLYKVVAGTGQVDSTGSLTVGPGGVCTLWRRADDTWYLFGSEIT